MHKGADMVSSPALANVSPAVPLKRKIAAIMAADVAGYSRLVAEAEERTLQELAAVREIFDAFVAQAGGRIFNTAGDSVMCEFDSAVEAVRAAVDIQESLRSRNQGVPVNRRLEFRIGLTIGDVVERGGDLLGDGVNIAARLEGLAPPGGICVSRSVHEAVANKLSVTFRELGPRQVKNIPQPIHAYLVAPPESRLQVPEPMTRPVRVAADTPRRRIAGKLLAIGLLIAGGAAAYPAWTALRSFVVAPRPAPPEATDRPQMANPPVRGEAPSVTPPQTPPPQTPARQVKGGDKPADKPLIPPKQAQREPPKADAPKTEPPKVEPPKVDLPKTDAPKTDTPKTDAPRADAPKSEPPPRTVAERDLPADPAAAFVALALEGLLQDARTLPELYHNARLYEAKGDRAAALAAYGAAAPLAGEALDVHLRHASLLRALKGAPAVRQAFGLLAKSSPSNAATLVLALSGEGDDRRAKVEAFAVAHPDMAAVDYLLADALVEGREGGPTLTERRLAFDALDRFVDASTTGDLGRHFVDRAFLASWIEGARRKRGEIEKAFASATTRPGVAFTRTGSGWLGRLTLPEPATAVSTRLGERGEFVSTGSARTVDPKTGKAAPSLEVEIPANAVRSTLYVTYADRGGRTAGPFPLPFDPSAATASSGREVLERYPDTWVSFRPDIPDLLSFAGLVSNRCAIARALIGYGDDAPRDRIPLPACDATGPASMPSSTAYVRLPDGTDSVQVQLTYADGTESQVRKFRRP